ncbi:MAG: serine/threonine-protein kinase [bacterium]|nr:serine/threonine-protein kinase [bacterium]
MGEVYRARDTGLGRDVAIKVLPEAVARDNTRIARFRREAQVLAKLNHPNIAGIHGVEESGGRYALVMEFADGPTLAGRLHRGAIPVEEAVPIARQIAEALEAAHDKGIIHRDLKPANIKVDSEGNVKVLDFGLAKALEDDSTAVHPEDSPTLTAAATRAGVILGTAAYMSPEQARGKPVDKRADLWAFGVVLYEMLTGRRLFGGETVSDSLAGVLKAEIDFSTLPAETPASIRRLLRRCLERDRKDRLHDIADARLELADTADDRSVAKPPPERRLVPWAVVAVVLAAAAFLTGIYTGREPSESEVVRFEIPPPEDGSFYRGPAISPDGRTVVFASTTPDLGRRLWVRRLDRPAAELLEGTEGGYSPFWSPDGSHIGYFASGKLMRISISGGPPQKLANSYQPRGGTWNADGTILFSSKHGLHRVAASGGEPAPLPSLGPGEDASYLWPHFLPDGRHFLYLTLRRGEKGIFVGSLDDGAGERIVNGGTKAEYASGHLFYLRGYTLIGQPFDPGRLRTTGEAFPAAEGVGNAPSREGGYFSASSSGALVYRDVPPEQGPYEWFDRTGHPAGTVVGSESASGGHAEIAPDGSRIAFDRADPETGQRDIWIHGLARKTTTRLTSDAGEDWVPVWSPDGNRIAYTADRNAAYPGEQLYLTESSGAGKVEVLLESENRKHHLDWSADGKLLAYEVEGSAYDLWILPMEGERKPFPFLATEFNEAQPQFSPGRRWLAYISDESGGYQVYARSLAEPQTEKVQISTRGGFQPRWREDGRELYYLTPDGKMMAVPVNPGRSRLGSGVPSILFQAPLHGVATSTHYAVTGDGQRFLLRPMPEANVSSRLNVILNWTAGLKQ